MVGAGIARRLAREKCEILTVQHRELDLRRQSDVEAWVDAHKPDVVVVAAATVGGIFANNNFPADFLYNNVAISINVIHAAHRAGVKKLAYLGSSCIYPRAAQQPMREDFLLTGAFEPTNQWYAIAKSAGIMQCQAYRRQYGDDFISIMPTNLYGPGDTFDPQGGHVIPALMLKAHQAKQSGAQAIELWGTGSPLREFMHVDDMAEAVVFLLRRYSGEPHVNVGTGREVSIREVAELIIKAVGFKGELTFDTTKPDGMPRKLLDSGVIHGMGWKARIGLEEGLRDAYEWFLTNKAE